MAWEATSADPVLPTDDALPYPSPSSPLPTSTSPHHDDPHSSPSPSPSPSPPTLADIQQQSQLLTHQLHNLVTSIDARSGQYTSLTLSYLSLLSTSVDGVVDEAEACSQLAEEMMTQAEAMNKELDTMDEVERAVRQCAEQVMELEKRMNRALLDKDKSPR